MSKDRKSRPWRRWLAGTVAVAATLGIGRATLAGDYEEPAYALIATLGDVEIRRYAPTIEARVEVEAPYDQAVSMGFRPLAKYIFGGNAPEASIAMTAPVGATPKGEEIAMTAPVGAQGEGDRWVVSFTMPSEWTMETLPAPLDPRVQLVEVPGRVVAVRSFTWKARSRAVDEEKAALLATLSAHGLAPAGPIVVNQYDPPWIPGPLRRNEIMVPLSEEAAAALEP